MAQAEPMDFRHRHVTVQEAGSIAGSGQSVPNDTWLALVRLAGGSFEDFISVPLQSCLKQCVKLCRDWSRAL